MSCCGSNTHQFVRHIRRVFGYARNSDYALAGGMAATSPLAFWAMEKLSPSGIGRNGFSPIMRLAATIGIVGGLHVLYQRSASTFFSFRLLSPRLITRIGDLRLFTDRFYGFTENKREVEMDMREMVDKVKKGEPLYGVSQMSSYLQGVAARNSRYSSLFIHVVPWANFANHDQVSCIQLACSSVLTVLTSFL